MHNPRQTMLVAVVRMTENPKRWRWGAALTMPEPFLAFSSSWKKFSNSLPSIYPFPAKTAKQKKPLTSELESKTDGGQVQWGSWECRGELIITGQEAGVWASRGLLGVLLYGLQPQRSKINNRISLGYTFCSQETLGGISISARLAEVSRSWELSITSWASSGSWRSDR